MVGIRTVLLMVVICCFSCGREQGVNNQSPQGAQKTHPAKTGGGQEGLFKALGEFRLVAGLKMDMAWGTPAIQTPTPLTSGTDSIHFADVAKSWATFIRAPTGLGNPACLSVDEKLVASSGTLGKVDVSNLKEWLHVVRVNDGKVLWSRMIREGVVAMRWDLEGSLWYVTNPRRLKTGPAGYVVRRLGRGLKASEDIYEAPKGMAVWGIFPSPTGKYLIVREQINARGQSGAFLIDVKSKEKRKLVGKEDKFHPHNIFWWPNEKNIYVELDNRPCRLSLNALEKRDFLTRSMPKIGDQEVNGSLAPSGKLLFVSSLKTGTVYLADLDSGQVSEVLSVKSGSSAVLRSVDWSRDETVVGGWIGVSGKVEIQEGMLGPKHQVTRVSWYPIILSLRNNTVAVFRSSQYVRPFFFVEEPRTIAALKKQAKPWK